VSAAPPSLRGGVAPNADPPRVRGRLAPDAMFPDGLPGYRTRFEMLRSGERVRIVEMGPTGGEAVILFPGWGAPVWDFHQTLPALAAAGFRAVAVDLRGHGLSDMPLDPSRYTTDAMVAHALAVLEAIGVSPVALIGHSMGGALAMHVALRAPARVCALALVSPIGFGIARAPRIGRMLSPSWAIPVLRALVRRRVIAAGLRILYGSNERVTPRSVDEFWAASQFEGFVPATRALLHGFRWNRFTEQEMAAVAAPGLVVHGTRDPIVHPTRGRRSLPTGWRELVIDGAGHLPHDEAPELVNPAIIEFLKRPNGRAS
jgi:pyruvate dehydrogenase E2 component (dihydrolipoamide acetyltransferase)